MIYFYFSFFIATPIKAEELDLLDKLILAHKSDKLKDFYYYFGEPKKIDTKTHSPHHLYEFKDKTSSRSFESFYDPSSDRVITSAIIFWQAPKYSIDGYSYMKRRFQEYRWNEKPKKSELACVIQDLYDIKIPELGMSFTADKCNPAIELIALE